MKNKTIEDILICPYCGSDNCFCYDHDEVEFGKGGLLDEHVIMNCDCKDCHKNFQVGFQFEYNITKHWVRK